MKLGLRGSSSFGDSKKNNRQEQNKKGRGGDLNGGEGALATAVAEDAVKVESVEVAAHRAGRSSLCGSSPPVGSARANGMEFTDVCFGSGKLTRRALRSAQPPVPGFGPGFFGQHARLERSFYLGLFRIKYIFHPQIPNIGHKLP